MNRFLLIIMPMLMLVSCNFNTERKIQINRRIKELKQRIEARSAQESADTQLLDSLMQHYYKDEGQPSNPDSMLRFFENMKPVSDHLGELQRQDLADKAEIDKLHEERSRM